MSTAGRPYLRDGIGRALLTTREGRGVVHETVSLREVVTFWKEGPEVHHDRNEQTSTSYVEYMSTDAANIIQQ